MIISHSGVASSPASPVWVQSQLMGLSLSRPSLKYGYFAEYQCHYSINCTGNLMIYINSSKRISSLNSTLKPRDYGYDPYPECKDDQFVLKFWMLINHETLNSPMTINCEYSKDHSTYNNRTAGTVEVSIDTDDIVYPCEECHKNNTVTTSEYNCTELVTVDISNAPHNGYLKRTIISMSSLFLTALFLIFINY